MSTAETTKFSFGIYNGGYSKRVNTEDGPDERWIETFSVYASSLDGRLWMLEGSLTEDHDAAAATLATLGNSNPDSDPVSWLSDEPMYGSMAWDSEAEHRLACFEADAYGEPRPRGL